MARTKSEPFRSLGFYAIAWIENFLVHGPGDVQGQQIELDDEFAAFLLRAYEVDGRGVRKVRRAFLSRAKGRNKSGFAAMVECFEALGECRFDHWAQPGEVSDWGYEFEPGEPVGRQVAYVEILNVATEEGQAGNTYDAVYYMLHPDTCSSELLARFGKIDVGITRTNLPGSRGSLEPVTAANESKDGGKSTFIVADETHLWIPPADPKARFRLGMMHQTMVRNLYKRRIASGWMLETSTMYAAGEKSVAEGTHANRTGKLLFDHRQASESWNLDNRGERIKALKEAYGPAAAWMDLQAIADYWDDPQASHAEFKRFFLNQPVPLVEPRKIDVVKWSSAPLCDREVEAPSRVVLVADVAPERDWASIGLAGDVDGRTFIAARFGRPAGKGREPGTAWVVPEIVKLWVRGGVDEVWLTPGQAAKTLKTGLVRAGVEFEVLTAGDMGAACSGVQEAVKAGTLVHVGQPELDAAVANAKTRYVGESEVFDRRDPGGPDISPLVACAGALFKFGMQEAPLPAIY